MGRKKVLITGVSGIVGSSAFLRLQRAPDKFEIYGLGRRQVLSERVIDKRAIDIPDERFFICDIADMAAVSQAVRGMDVVVHMAADPSGGEWLSVLRNNIVGGYNMFEACYQAGVGRLIAASTIQVSTGHRQLEPYCAVAQGRPQELPPGTPRIGADVPAEPRNIYASSKVFNESLCRTYAHSYGMSCIAIRIGWVVGEDRPRGAESADIWCSQRDIAALIECCIEASDELRFDIFYGISNNKYAWVDLEHARRQVGFEPQDRAEDHL